MKLPLGIGEEDHVNMPAMPKSLRHITSANALRFPSSLVAGWSMPSLVGASSRNVTAVQPWLSTGGMMVALFGSCHAKLR